MDKICLCPIPESVKFNYETRFDLRNNTTVSVADITLFKPLTTALKFLPVKLNPVIKAENAVVEVLKNSGLGEEEYTLSVSESGIKITAGGAAGCFYAFATLRQIIMQTGNWLPFCEISDSPHFKIRGYMLDVARNKIPTLERLKDLVDTLCLIKINHMELYFEGAPFQYKDYPNMWRGFDVLSAAEFSELDAYCSERYIELVPTQNTFGHMERWLNEGGYSDLAECPNGFISQPSGDFVPYPASLDPSDERSFKLVKNISDDLLSYSASDKYNVCCDETFELGYGKSKELSEKIGLDKVYFNYLMKLYNYCKENGKTMMFWADIINRHPHIVPDLPKDVIALNWGYWPETPSEESCINFEKSGIPYCVCPGTTVWNTMTGNIPQMLKNVRFCILTGAKHNALGVINTEWGDNGHLQGTFSAYPGMVYGAAMSWQPEENKDLDIPSVLNTLIFEDRHNIIGELFMKVGSYITAEAKCADNSTVTFNILNKPFGKCNEIKDWSHSDLDKVKKYLSDLLPLIDQPQLLCKNGDVVTDEMRNSVKLLLAALDFGHYTMYLKENDIESAKAVAEKLHPEFNGCINELIRLWLKTNKTSYLLWSLRPLLKKTEELYNFIRPQNTPPKGYKGN